MRTIKLVKPIVFEGETITELNLDFDSLNGDKILNAEQKFNSLSPVNSAIAIKEHAKGYQACVAAQAAKVPAELILGLGGLDFTEVTATIFLFFRGSLEDIASTPESSDSSQ